MSKFIEETIVDAVRRLLAERVNEILTEMEDAIPPIEFDAASGNGNAPVIVLTQGERDEKDRIVKNDVYAVSISFELPGMEGGDGAMPMPLRRIGH
jgi:hypothetical protein